MSVQSKLAVGLVWIPHPLSSYRLSIPHRLSVFLQLRSTFLLPPSQSFFLFLSFSEIIFEIILFFFHITVGIKIEVYFCIKVSPLLKCPFADTSTLLN